MHAKFLNYVNMELAPLEIQNSGNEKPERISSRSVVPQRKSITEFSYGNQRPFHLSIGLLCVRQDPFSRCWPAVNSRVPAKSNPSALKTARLGASSHWNHQNFYSAVVSLLRMISFIFTRARASPGDSLYTALLHYLEILFRSSFPFISIHRCKNIKC